MLVALCGQAFFLVAIGYCSCGQDKLVSVLPPPSSSTSLQVILLLCLSIGISGFQYAGFVVNYLDICPQFAGFVLGIGNTLSCLAGLISPILMGWLTPTVGLFWFPFSSLASPFTVQGSKSEWLLVFYVTAFILVAGAVFFCLLASADVQNWAKEEPEAREMSIIEKAKEREQQQEPLLKGTSGKE
jgi:hypothetical protein